MFTASSSDKPTRERNMSRFYGKRIVTDDEGLRYLVSIAHSDTEIEVSEDVFEALDDMQREFWRIDRRESRHTCHIEMMGEYNLPQNCFPKNPEQLLIEQIEATEIQQALRLIPVIQQRRFLLRHLIGLPIKQIAQIEGCSDRAVKYSLSLARNNLRQILSEF